MRRMCTKEAGSRRGNKCKMQGRKTPSCFEVSLVWRSSQQTVFGGLEEETQQLTRRRMSASRGLACLEYRSR